MERGTGTRWRAGRLGSAEDVGNNVILAGDVIDGVRELKALAHSACSAGVELVRATDEVLVEIVSSFGHDVDHGKPLLVDDEVALLELRECAAEIMYRVPTIRMLLLQNCSYTKLRGITGNASREVRAENRLNW